MQTVSNHFSFPKVFFLNYPYYIQIRYLLVSHIHRGAHPYATTQRDLRENISDTLAPGKLASGSESDRTRSGPLYFWATVPLAISIIAVLLG